ncbi:MAG: hypothetical protein EPO22_12710 [Dehalococcoidia bacterium]|nr:MAG: hypothetical protein EPO22_12710 [Dehalococcoidia bacterium]
MPDPEGKHEHRWIRMGSELPAGQQALHIFVRQCSISGCGLIETRVDGNPLADEGWLPTTPTPGSN